MGRIKRNVIKIDPLNYNIGLLGISGVGKTTVISQMLDILTPGTEEDPGYVFLECGKEDGADALNNIPYFNCRDWNGDFDEDNEHLVGFGTFIDDVIENKQEFYPNLRTVVVDTYDQAFEIAKAEAIRIHNKENPEKKVKTIKAAMGGYMAGEDYADDLILDKLWELKKVGVNFIIIGHVKTREVTDPISNDTYTQLTTDMSMRSFDKIKTKLHFLGLAYIDREIVKEKRKSGKKEKDVNVIKTEARKISFRDNDYAIDSKSRFADIIDEIPLDARELINALTNAIEAEASKGKKSISELKAEQAEEAKIAAQKANEYSKKIKESSVDEEKNAELITEIKKLFKTDNAAAKAYVKDAMHRLGASKFDELIDKPTMEIELMIAQYA